MPSPSSQPPPVVPTQPSSAGRRSTSSPGAAIASAAATSDAGLAGLVARLRAAGCVFAEDEAQLLTTAAHDPAELAALVERRAAGEPLEHLLGWAEFCGLRIIVEPGVFVPRRRTEFLVHQAAILAVPIIVAERRPVVVDLCCGSAAVGVALVAALGEIELYAADIESAAVHCARRNVGAAGQVLQGDLYGPLPVDLRGRVDILAVNAPYVPTDAIALMPPEARLHEPHSALDGGPDGLDIQRRIAAAAPRWLVPGGHLLIETSDRQAEVTAGIFVSSGLTAQIVTDDELDGTVVVGTLHKG
jgi:release factor glutamine methyltransferase